MSIRLQHLREAWSYLSTFVGKLGEIVVDTTNNRLVLHDGTTVGGWPIPKLAETLVNTRKAVADADYAALASDRLIAFTSISTARTLTLPAASAFPTGTRLSVVDESGACSPSNAITLACAGADTINGAASAGVTVAYGYIALESDGASKWTIVDQASGANSPFSGDLGSGGAAGLVPAPAAGDTAADKFVYAGGGFREPSYRGFANRFRNGTMDVWQRGTSATAISTSGAYFADGWIIVPSGAAVTAQQAAGRGPTLYSLKVSGAASVTGLVIKQRLESAFAAALAGQSVTVQAQVYNATGSAITPTLSVKHAGAQDDWTSPTTDVSAAALQSCANGAWTCLAYTFSAAAAAANGLELAFDFGNNFGATGQSLQITELDIRTTPNVSSGLNAHPPAPELRPVGIELFLCQRYFVRFGEGIGSYDPVGMLFTLSSTQAYGIFVLPVPIRAPTSAVLSYSALSDWWANFVTLNLTPTAISLVSITSMAVRVGVNVSGATAGQAGELYGQTSNARIYISAEL